MRLALSLSCIIMWCCCATFRAHAGTPTIPVCDDVSEWAPYTYLDPTPTATGSHPVAGAMVDLLDVVGQKMRIDFEITLMPWKRCLSDVASHAPAHWAVVNGSINPERLNRYDASIPIYRVTPGVYVNTKSRHRGASPISRVSELNQGRVCGISGYNYQEYLDAGLTNDIDTGAKDITMAIAKLLAGRCDYLLASIEVMEASRTLNLTDVPSNIQGFVLSDVEKPVFYILVSKHAPDSKRFLNTLNQTLRTLQQNGTTNTIFKKYLNNGTAL